MGTAPPQYPAHLVRERRLADGRTVTIRPARADDGPRLRAFLAGVSPENRYLRFQKWVKGPTENVMRYFSGVDYDRHMAFVCTTAGDGGEEIVGDARYVVYEDGVGCDFAIVIADGWHQSGIAGLLMEALIRAARARGLKSMESLVLSTNRQMLKFARQLGFKREPAGEATQVCIIKKL